MDKKNKNSRRAFLQHSVMTAAAFSMAPATRIATKQGQVDDSPGKTRDNKEYILFAFDDHCIPWQHNLKTTLVQAQKYAGNPVLKRGSAGTPDHGHAILYGTVIKDAGKFKMWYLAMFESEVKGAQAPGLWRPMCYAESTDGINWVKPELGLTEFNGNKRNNICLIEGLPQSLTRVDDFLSVLHEPEDPNPAHRYKAVYIAHVPYDDIKGGMSNIGTKEKRICSTIGATSADGLSWKVVGDRPANAGGERFEVSGLYRFDDFYYLTGQLLSPWSWLPDGRDAGRVLLVYRSSDFVTWSKAKAFGFARPGQLTGTPVKGQQTHMGAGMWNRGNVMVGLYGMWQDGLGPAERPKGASHLLGTHTDLGIILSNDGIHFREPVADFKVIARGKENEWDNVALLQAHAFINEGDKTMIWYSHWDTGGELTTMEIGMATLRRDGFGYLSRKEDDNDAHFISATMEAGDKQKLFINVEGLSADAPIAVELLDNKDRPLPGYSGSQACTISTDGTRQQVAWPGKAYLPAKGKYAIQVKFPVNSQAKVYALYIERL